jgi:hypothetical protein
MSEHDDAPEVEEIDERLSDPDEPSVTDTFTDAQGQRYIDGQPATEEEWQERLEAVAETEAILDDPVTMAAIEEAEADLEAVNVVEHPTASDPLAAARDVEGYEGQVLHLYDADGNVLDGPFRKDVAFGLEIQPGHELR